jgi:UDP:flavonoid glycosyltransferase YjiC (YdhE family)
LQTDAQAKPARPDGRRRRAGALSARLLFSFAGGTGHAEPLVPLARTAAAGGHTVAFTGRRSAVGPEFELEFFPTGAERPPKRIPMRELDPEREQREFRAGFAGRLARERADEVRALCVEWRPDLVVCDETDFGAMLVAERLRLPYAGVCTTAPGFIRRELIADPLAELRAHHGLPPDPELVMLSRYLVLSPFPPSLRDPGPARCFRTVVGAVERTGGPPTVYFTLGTVFNLESGDLFARVLAGLRTLDVDVVATVGRQIDPDELGPQPERIRVERYLPHSAVLPRCDAVVSHGGSGSVLGALAYGLPSVLLPMGADQPWNAARCEELGVALVLDAMRATPDDVREAVSTVLEDASYRAAAGRVRDEIRALPGPEHALALLERLLETER